MLLTPMCPPCCQSSSGLPICCNTRIPPEIIYAHIEKTSPFDASACSPDGPWDIVLIQDQFQSWSYASSTLLSSFPCNTAIPFPEVRIACGRERLDQLGFILNDLTIGSPGSIFVPTGYWWISAVSVLMRWGATTNQLVSCSPFHLIFEFVETIYNADPTHVSWSNGTGHQGWRIEVTE